MDPLCETKPIARSGAPRRCLNCGLRIADWGQPCSLPPPACGGQNAQNKPNSRRTASPTILLCYRSTTPIRCRLCKTNPIWKGIGRERPTDQEQIAPNKAKLAQDGESGESPPQGGATVQNEPNSRRRRLGRGLRERGSWDVAQTKPIPWRGLPCETKPIAGGKTRKTRCMGPAVWHRRLAGISSRMGV